MADLSWNLPDVVLLCLSLRRHLTLESVNLTGRFITSAAVPHLRRALSSAAPKLRHVGLTNTELGREGVEAIVADCADSAITSLTMSRSDDLAGHLGLLRFEDLDVSGEDVCFALHTCRATAEYVRELHLIGLRAAPRAPPPRRGVLP